VPDVSVRIHHPPPVSSISGGFTFRKLSDIQEVRTFFSFLSLLSKATAPQEEESSVGTSVEFAVFSDTGGADMVSGAKLVCKSTKSRDHHQYSSEDNVTFVPVSQQNGSLTHQKVNVSHITAVNEFPTRKEDALNDAPVPQDFVCIFCSLDFVFLEL
jgi:hypothetical protein